METNLKGNELSPQRLRPPLKAFDNSRINGRRPCLNTVDPTIREFDDESSPPAEDQDLVEENPGQTYVTASREPHRWAITSDYLNRGLSSPHIMESKKVLDSGQHAVDSGFQALDFSLSQQNLDSGFQSLVIGIPRDIFRIPKPTIPNSTQKRSCISLHGATQCNRKSCSQLRIKPPGKMCHRTQLLILSEL